MRWTRPLAALALAAVVMPATILAQAGRITGTVTDRAAGQPISDATINVVGTNRLGVRAGADGRYTISVQPGRYRLRALRLGFAPRDDSVSVAAGQTVTVNFALAQTSIVLDQMVVTGYGFQKRSDLTGSISSVTPRADQTPVLSLEQTLQGTVPGVTVTQASSAPGGGMTVRIRGGTSVTGNNEPLYVIDGFPIENDAEGQNPSDGGRPSETSPPVPSNPLAALNPGDIESIEILKDASATSIYGARGANGVIMITTKQGRAARPKFTLDTYTGTQSVAHRYHLLNGKQFAEFANAWSANNGTGVVFADPSSVIDTDWQSQIFRNAPMHNIQAGLTGSVGATSSTRYSISGGIYQQDGVVINSGFRRVSIRGNLDQGIGEKLRFGSTLTMNRATSNFVPTDGALNAGAGAVGAAINYYPVLPVRQANGTYTLMSLNSPSPILQAQANLGNPVSMAQDVTDKLGDTRALANAFGEYLVLDGLKFRVQIGADLSSRARDSYYPRTTLLGSQTNGLAVRGKTQTTNFLNENTLSYNKSIGTDHQFDAVAGYTRQQNDGENTQIKNTNFVSDIDVFESIGAGTQIGGPQVSSGHTRWTLASYLGRVNYTLLNRYLFTVTGRRDGSSRFGADHQWGFFPSAAIGWRVSDEPFMTRFPQVELLKLRVSTGLAGNPSIKPYQSMAHLLPQQYTFGGTVVPGYYPSSVANTELGWESTRQTDYGVDLGLWGGRVSLNADIYKKTTNDVLLAVNLPFESGFASALQNAGSVSNNGFDLGLTLTMLDPKKGDFGWSSTFNYSRNKNKVLDLGNGVQQIFANSVNNDLKLLGSLIQVGQSLGVFYGFKTDGLLRDSATAAAYTTAVKPLSGTRWNAGDAKLIDINGDGAITSLDRTIIGDPNPKYTGGWSNTLSFRGLRLSALLDFTQGNQILNLNNIRLEQGSPATNVIAERYLDAWSTTNPNGKYPRINFTPGTIGSDITTDLLDDGSFTRLRNVTLEAPVPTRLLARYGITNTRVYVTGSNLVTWTKYSGFNPDVSSLGLGNVNRGIDVGSYPLAKSVTFGLNITY